MNEYYARYLEVDDTKCVEVLDEHLALTAASATALYTASFGSRADPTTALGVALAGLLHDVAKALSVYYKRFDKEKKLSFSNPPHEILSARIARAVLLGCKDRLLSIAKDFDMYDFIEYLVVRPIESHHQGLRTITFEKLRDVPDSILERDVDIESVNRVISRAKDRLLKYIKNIDLIPPDIVNTIQKLNELDLQLRDAKFEKPRHSRGQHLSITTKLLLYDESKIVTGFLVAADYLSVELNLSKISDRCLSRTRLSEEIHRYADSLGILNYLKRAF